MDDGNIGGPTGLHGPEIPDPGLDGLLSEKWTQMLNPIGPIITMEIIAYVAILQFADGLLLAIGRLLRRL